MEEKPDKKKESIDEILSDLNGLLNKMPSILDGIKMPEMQPMETPKARPQENAAVPPETVSQSPADAGENNGLLQPFTGLEGSSPAPAGDQPEPAIEPQPEPAIEPQPEPAIEPQPEPAIEPQPEPAIEPQPEPAVEPVLSFDAEKTVVLDAFSGLPEGSPAPEPEQLAPQSLGDFMFGENAEPVEEPAYGAPAKLSGSALEPPEEKRPAPVSDVKPLSISEFTPPPDKSETPAAAALPQYDNTRDFGIPDIDSLMQMSDSGQAQQEEPAAQLPEAGVIPESVQAAEADSGLSIQGLDEAQPFQVVSEGGIMDANEPKEEKTEAPLSAEASPEQEPAQDGQPPQQAESPFDIFAIESSSGETAPAQDSGEKQPEPVAEMPQPGGGGEIPVELSAEIPQEPLGAETINEQAAEPVQGGEGLQFEPAAETAPQEPQLENFPAPEPVQPEAQAAPAEASTGGIELSPGIEFGSQPQAEAADQTIPGTSGLEGADQPQGGAAGLEIPGGAGLELSVGRPQAEGADQTIPGGTGMVLDGGDGDATLVVAPAGGSSGEEEKTVIFQAPATTSRAQAGDLDELASKQAPEGIPAERLRTLMFLYAADDKALCATALAELDAICLRSSTKPMFIKRAAVRECEPDANANFLMQSMTDAGAQGLVCLGDVPQDKVYEIENVYNTAGGFFRYYDSSTFSHSAALDLVTDLILR